MSREDGRVQQVSRKNVSSRTPKDGQMHTELRFIMRVSLVSLCN